jgi:hypothetical protein
MAGLKTGVIAIRSMDPFPEGVLRQDTRIFRILFDLWIAVNTYQSFLLFSSANIKGGRS